jgi:NTE family protein
MNGIVLEGGGGRGAYQIGVWQALRELGFDFQGVAGTSVGALNGALMVQGDFDRAYDLWSQITPSRIVDIDDDLYERVRNWKLTAEDTNKLLQGIRAVMRGGGMDTNPLRHLLLETIDEGKVRSSGRELAMVTVSLANFAPQRLYLSDIPNGRLVDYLLASASLPVFKRHTIDGRPFLDGGLYDNLPVSLLVDKGYDQIIAVRLSRVGYHRWDQMDGVTVIKPGESLGQILDFSPERAGQNIHLGYFDALRALRGYSGTYCCIDVNRQEDYFLHRWLSLDVETVHRLAEILGQPGCFPLRRLLLEKLVPQLSDLLGLDLLATYCDIFVALLDRAARRARIERWRTYRYDELADLVGSSQEPAWPQSSLRLPSLPLVGNLNLLMRKDEVLDAVTACLLAVGKK